MAGGCRSSVPLSALQRATGRAAGAAMAIAAAALLADPVWFSGAWPWDVAPLTGRLLGVWLVAFAAAYAWALWDGDWPRVRPLYLAAPFTGLLLAFVPLTHTGDLRPDAGGELVVYYALAAARRRARARAGARAAREPAAPRGLERSP